MAASPVYTVLSETSLPAAAWQIFRGRELALLEVAPHWGRNGRWLHTLAGRWRAQGKLRDAADHVPALAAIERNEHYHDMTDLFLKAEPWVEGHFGFGLAERLSPGYHLPYKHTCWGAVYDHAHLAHRVERILREAGAGTQFLGVPALSAGLAREYGQITREGSDDRAWRHGLVNFVSALLLLGFIGKWIGRRVVRALPQKRHSLLGSTYARDIRLIHNLGDIVDSRDQVAIMFHDEGLMKQANRDFDLTGFQQILFGDGRYLPGQAVRTVAAVARDLFHLLRAFGGRSPGVFFKLGRLVWYRTAYAALFRTHTFGFFWGRDEINADHMIRSQELRRTGGVSMGICHGIPTAQILSPLRRIQDYDVYFQFGIGIYKTFFHQRWPAHMRVLSMGAFGMSHAQMKDIKVQRSRDVMVFASNTLDDKAIIRESVRLAELLPDRKIFFKCKPGCLDAYQQFIDGNPPAPPNLEFVTAEIAITYEFLRMGGYAVASHSTLGAEGIYYGTPTFVHDNQPPDMPFYYREFPQLCFADASEVVRRIKAIEAGEETYPWHLYGELIDLSNRFPMSIVRHEMGLPAKPGEDVCQPLLEIRGEPAA